MAQSDRLTEAQLMEALGSLGVDVETVTRLTLYLTAPGMTTEGIDLARKTRSMILDRLFKTADALKTADQAGKL